MNILSVQVSARKKVYVTFEEDTAPNKGGYYCRVYADPYKEEELDDLAFTIQGSMLRGSSDRERSARALATSKVKNQFGIF